MKKPHNVPVRMTSNDTVSKVRAVGFAKPTT